jgi:ketosteroid isomerase-like protein
MNSDRHLILIFLLFIGLSQGYSQTEKEQILDLRNASNLALKANDIEKILSYLTDDILLTSGNGNLIAGKDALRAYTLKGDLSTIYWQRTPNEVEINEERKLAWETGTWNVYKRKKDDKSILGGKYSAMWSKESGSWLIKSQLFVTLE